MRCPKCGAECVWDHADGVWICPECHGCFDLMSFEVERGETDLF